MSPLTTKTPLLAEDSPLDAVSKALIHDIYEAEQEKAKNLPTDDPLDPKRKKRVVFTYDEMIEQPAVVERNLHAASETIKELAKYLAGKNINKVYFTGCGDSVAAMIAVRSAWENLLGIPCEPIQALDFTYFYHQPVDDHSLVVTLSSSGKTTRTVEAMLMARAKGAITLCLSNTQGSPLMAESDRGILIDAERKGWPTQSSTAAMALLYLLGIQFAKHAKKNVMLADRLEMGLLETPELIEQVLSTHQENIKAVAAREAEKEIYLFSSGGPTFGSALIGAAKVKECSPNHAIAIPLEEYHHYNSQKAGDPLWLLAPQGFNIPRAVDTAHEGRRWGGKIYSLTTEKVAIFDELSDEVFFLPEINEMLSPMIYTIPLQMFAYDLAMAKFARAERL